jgi:hypothetical protein
MAENYSRQLRFRSEDVLAYLCIEHAVVVMQVGPADTAGRVDLTQGSSKFRLS